MVRASELRRRVAADPERVGDALRQVDEAAGVELEEVVARLVGHPALEDVERLGLLVVAVQRRGDPRRLGDQGDAEPAALAAARGGARTATPSPTCARPVPGSRTTTCSVSDMPGLPANSSEALSDKYPRPHGAAGQEALRRARDGGPLPSARRLGILAAARDLFTEGGYAATSVQAVADRAGVSLDTVYASGRPQAAAAARRPRHGAGRGPAPVPAEQRDYVRAVRAAPTAEAMIRTYAAAMARVLPHTVPIMRALREAGVTEPDCAAQADALSERRAANMRLFVADLRRHRRAAARAVRRRRGGPDLVAEQPGVVRPGHRSRSDSRGVRRAARRRLLRTLLAAPARGCRRIG